MGTRLPTLFCPAEGQDLGRERSFYAFLLGPRRASKLLGFLAPTWVVRLAQNLWPRNFRIGLHFKVCNFHVLTTSEGGVNTLPPRSHWHDSLVWILNTCHGAPTFLKEQRGTLTLPPFPCPFCSCHSHPQFKEIVLFSGTGW